jgi:hypothetical protein
MSEPPIFVFGSNLAGRHGKGAALFAAQERGAVRGQGYGPQGRSYAIPTKDEKLAVLPLADIAGHVAAFLVYADRHPHERFEVTAIGTGLAGYRPEEIAPMFRAAPSNCDLPRSFLDVLESLK